MLSSRRRLHPAGLICALPLLFVVEAATAQQTHAVSQGTLAAMLAAPLATPPAGGGDAAVTIVEYFDYNCPVCRKVDPMVRRLLAADPKVRLVRKDWAIFGDGSVYAAYASFAADRQGRYAAAHQALMTSSRYFDTARDVLAVLKAAGFDAERIAADIAYHQKEYSEVLSRNAREASALGLQGTPGIVVGNQLVLGTVTYRGLRQLVVRVRGRS